MKNEDRGKIIKEARERLGLTPGDLAARINVSRISVLNWENGLALKGDNLEKLASELGLSIELLQKGKKVNTAKNTVYKNDNQSVIIRAFPLLKVGQVEEWIQNPVVANKHAMINMPILDKKYSKSAFLFEIIGKSMINKEDPADSLFPDEVAIVEPPIKPKDGDLVLVKFGENDLRPRQYREDGAYKFLCAFDPDIKSIELTNDMTIIGTIVGSYRNR